MGRRDTLKTVAEDARKVLEERPGPKPRRDRSWDAKRSKATYDLPPELIARIKQIAGEIGARYGAKVRVSDVARLLLNAGLERYEMGGLEIEVQPTELRLYSD